MSPRVIRPLELDDLQADFQSGVHALDDFLVRHAVTNERAGICRVYVRPRTDEDPPGLPAILGYYTLSMADVEAEHVASALRFRLPRYPMPVALIGRLAVDRRARGRRVGEALLLDSLRRTLAATAIVGCVGVVVDAKDAGAEGFYAKYDFACVGSAAWPRRMFLPIGVVRDAFDEPAEP